jgi:four helix bundle protein
MPNEKNVKYDLEERTALFAESVIDFAKKISRNPINDPLINQFIRSGTSVGANYCEADSAESRKDFCHKMGICKKEAKETRYWIRIIAHANPELKEEARILWKESNELLLIFNAIINKTKSKNKDI